MVVNATEKTGKHKRGDGDGRVQSEMMVSESRPEKGEGRICGEEALQVEGAASAQVLRQGP